MDFYFIFISIINNKWQTKEYVQNVEYQNH